MKILILIPAYNESEKIRTVIEESKKHLPVLVIDDGSTDDTGVIASEMGAEVIKQTTNLGKGAALKTGFKYAIDQGYQAVIILDGDGQHDPREIPKFLACYASSGGNLIIGKRDFSKMPPTRRLANSLGGILVNWISKYHIPDNQSGYRLLDAEVMNLLLDSEEMGFEFEVEMIFASHAKGLKVDWVPIKTIYSDEKSHISPLKHLANFFRIIRKMARKYS
jgi:glycosyltransferase involved in cell wall biosynthesis